MEVLKTPVGEYMGERDPDDSNVWYINAKKHTDQEIDKLIKHLIDNGIEYEVLEDVEEDKISETIFIRLPF